MGRTCRRVNETKKLPTVGPIHFANLTRASSRTRKDPAPAPGSTDCGVTVEMWMGRVGLGHRGAANGGLVMAFCQQPVQVAGRDPY